jgi:hypothetical protein
VLFDIGEAVGGGRDSQNAGPNVDLQPQYQSSTMSKSESPAPAKPTVDFKVGDVVLAKVKGFRAWPSVVS